MLESTDGPWLETHRLSFLIPAIKMPFEFASKLESTILTIATFSMTVCCARLTSMALMHKTWPPTARNRVRGTFPECDPLRFTVDLFLLLSQFLVFGLV